ncbi:MAG TPA: AI-2E family transporter [Pseudomonadales bacterium]|nr:AI-2E family transporter [Pseudomonadales bacterium]
MVAEWFQRRIANRQLVILILVMASIGIVIYLAGNILAPVMAAVVIAYLLQGVINRLTAQSVPSTIAFWLVFIAAIALSAALTFGLLPLLVTEISEMLRHIPEMMSGARRVLDQLPDRYPDLITVKQVNGLSSDITNQILQLGQRLVSYSVTSAVTALTLMVYLILVPFLVFFMVKDKDLIIDWLLQFLPDDRSLTNEVWRDVNHLIDRYIQGKIWEIAIVGAVTYAVFLILGLDYALLLAVATGISVVIPYIGATVVTVPVAFVAYYEFGWSLLMLYTVGSYLVIQALDGNLLVPILFGEVVNLHPVAIIVAVLFFGGIWGFWGVFFAIPLATVIHAVITAWPDLAEVEQDGADLSSRDNVDQS